jgi:hypothetical protein
MDGITGLFSGTGGAGDSGASSFADAFSKAKSSQTDSFVPVVKQSDLYSSFWGG